MGAKKKKNIKVEEILKDTNIKILFEPDYEEVPVSIGRFLTDEKYLGRVGVSIYPKWKKELNELFAPGNNIIEVVFSGATRTGKSTIASIIQLYNIYKLICLKDPSAYYGLISSEPIAIALFNITEELAYDVTFRKFKGYMELSPWFMQRVDLNRTGSWINLPKNIRILLGSRATHALGNAVIGGIMDEVDFSKTNISQYKEIYNTYLNIRRRMEGQFLKYLKKDPPGMLCLISSVTNDTNSFLESRIKAAKKYNNIKVMAYSQWDVKMEDGVDWSKIDYFYVYVGDDSTPATIIKDKKIENIHSDRLLKVPMEYLQAFEEDLERALMDIAGVRPGYKNRSFIHVSNADFSNRQSLFIQDTIELGLKSPIKKIEYYLRDKSLKSIEFKNLSRFIHVDLSKNRDMTGISCVTGYAQDRKLYYYVDFVIRLKAPIGDEIDYASIRDFIVYLLDKGVKIEGISYDNFQSYDSLQFFKKLGKIPTTKLISVDKKTESYYLLRNAFIEKRINLTYSDVLYKELNELQEDLVSGIIDHPPDGSKDMADALAGSLFLCTEVLSQKIGNWDETLNELKTKKAPIFYDTHIKEIKEKITNIDLSNGGQSDDRNILGM
jgi:hypothetical protein